jgi:hypothetical protein
MAKAQIEPTVPSEGDVEHAREVRRALERLDVDRGALRVQIAGAGHKATTIDLPPVVTDTLSRWSLSRRRSPHSRLRSC